MKKILLSLLLAIGVTAQAGDFGDFAAAVGLTVVAKEIQSGGAGIKTLFETEEEKKKRLAAERKAKKKKTYKKKYTKKTTAKKKKVNKPTPKKVEKVTTAKVEKVVVTSTKTKTTEVKVAEAKTSVVPEKSPVPVKKELTAVEASEKIYW